MAVQSITAKWIVDQLFTRFKLAFEVVKFFPTFSDQFDWLLFPRIGIWKPSFENISIFGFKCSQNSLKLTRSMHICLKMSFHCYSCHIYGSYCMTHTVRVIYIIFLVPSFLAISLSFLELFLQSFLPSSHHFLNIHECYNNVINIT